MLMQRTINKITYRGASDEAISIVNSFFSQLKGDYDIDKSCELFNNHNRRLNIVYEDDMVIIIDIMYDN